MPPSIAIVKLKLAQIESEMKHIGMWQTQPLPPGTLDSNQAFGGDKLAFNQWLQFVLLPNARKIIATNGEFPSHSQVADQAFREWRMWGDEPNVDQLIQLLREFDALFS
jgi:uncharacterized protein YqcC (DUF446 family)